MVKILRLDELVPAIEGRIADGFLYGDFQFDIDPASADFLTRGVFSCYRPVEANTAPPAAERTLDLDDWLDLFYLAHAEKTKAFEAYSKYYLIHRRASLLVRHPPARGVSRRLPREAGPPLGDAPRGTEMITEVYVPRESLVAVHGGRPRQDFRENGANLIYGTIRFIEKDDRQLPALGQGALRQHHLQSPHRARRTRRSRRPPDDFRGSIDRAIQFGGSYYLTYHHWATRKQVETCYPQFVEFLGLKRKYDPRGAVPERVVSVLQAHVRGCAREMSISEPPWAAELK